MTTDERLATLETKVDGLIKNDIFHIRIKLDNIDKRLWATLTSMIILSFIAGVNVTTQILGLIK